MTLVCKHPLISIRNLPSCWKMARKPLPICWNALTGQKPTNRCDIRIFTCQEITCFQLLMVFSMKGAGLSNISIDFVKHIIKMCTYVFPHILLKISKSDFNHSGHHFVYRSLSNHLFGKLLLYHKMISKFHRSEFSCGRHALDIQSDVGDHQSISERGTKIVRLPNICTLDSAAYTFSLE